MKTFNNKIILHKKFNYLIKFYINYQNLHFQKKPFKRNIAPPSQDSFNYNSNQVNPEFYPSPPISNPNFGSKQNTYNSQPQPKPQLYQHEEGQQPFNYKVNYNEGDDKSYHSNFNSDASFKKSPQEGGAAYQQPSSYPASSFTPSFGGAGKYHSVENISQNFFKEWK